MRLKQWSFLLQLFCQFPCPECRVVPFRPGLTGEGVPCQRRRHHDVLDTATYVPQSHVQPISLASLPIINFKDPPIQSSPFVVSIPRCPPSCSSCQTNLLYRKLCTSTSRACRPSSTSITSSWVVWARTIAISVAWDKGISGGGMSSMSPRK